MTEETQNEIDRLITLYGIDVPTKTGYVVGQGKPYVPPAQDGEPPVFDYQMKRFLAVVGFSAFCMICCSAAEHGSFDGGLTIFGWALGISCAYALGKRVLVDCFEWKKREDSQTF